MIEGTPEKRTLFSILDVVEELAWTVEDKRWSKTVSEVFNKHRAELRGEEPQKGITRQFPRRR